jgi:hypothetical protein
MTENAAGLFAGIDEAFRGTRFALLSGYLSAAAVFFSRSEVWW